MSKKMKTAKMLSDFSPEVILPCTNFMNGLQYSSQIAKNVFTKQNALRHC